MRGTAPKSEFDVPVLVIGIETEALPTSSEDGSSGYMAYDTLEVVKNRYHQLSQSTLRRIKETGLISQSSKQVGE